jgi:hypothetical protein
VIGSMVLFSYAIYLLSAHLRFVEKALCQPTLNNLESIDLIHHSTCAISNAQDEKNWTLILGNLTKRVN